jgi:hypothetical protein
MARSLCIYGPTGSRKTTQVKWFSRYIAEITGKPTLLLSLSGGGWSPMCDPEVAAGMIEPYRCDAAVTPLFLLRKISQGYWPAYPDAINEALLAIQSGEQTADVMQSASLIRIDWSKYGGMAIEDWTAISDLIMRFLPDKGISVGGENRFQIYKNGASSAFAQVGVVNGELVTESFGSNILPDYGYVLNTLSGLVTNFNSLPAHTVMYTALEAKTTEDGEKSGKPIYGPDIAGKKATAKCGSWVGDFIHAQDYPLPVNVMVKNPSGEGEIEQTLIKTTVRFFYVKHPDPDTGIIFPAKPRCAPEKILELEKVWPGGYFEPEFGAEWGINRYLELMDQLAGDAAKQDSLKGWRERMDAKLGRAK